VTTDQDLNRVLAGNLRNLRTSIGVSQEELAHRCGLHRTYIGAIERGERNVTLNTVTRVAEGLGVNPLELLRK
jgi:transcriptional regulator with XRE-family HTH domain